MTKHLLLVILPEKVHKHKEQLMKLVTKTVSIEGSSSTTSEFLFKHKLSILIGLTVLLGFFVAMCVFCRGDQKYIVNDADSEITID